MKQVNQVVNIALQENGLLQVLVLVQIVLRVINVMEPELKLNVQAGIMLHQVPALAIVVLAENIVIQDHQVVQVAQADGHIVALVLQADVQVATLDIHYLVEVAEFPVHPINIIQVEAVKAVVQALVQVAILALQAVVIVVAQEAIFRAETAKAVVQALVQVVHLALQAVAAVVAQEAIFRAEAAKAVVQALVQVVLLALRVVVIVVVRAILYIMVNVMNIVIRDMKNLVVHKDALWQVQDTKTTGITTSGKKQLGYLIIPILFA